MLRVSAEPQEFRVKLLIRLLTDVIIHSQSTIFTFYVWFFNFVEIFVLQMALLNE